ncbi:MAG: damage-inducible protein CinA [Rhizobium sp.]|nr:damage-inducible protein CinA [Rhizobium sp.]
MNDRIILELAQEVVRLCTEKNVMIATAESCTGGLVAGAITEISGASQVLERGFITYSDQAKIEMIGVMPITLREFGAVSKDVALEMAHGAMSRSEAGISVSTTGIAGPSGGSTGKPVGLVHFGGRHYKGKLIHREMKFGEIGRHAIRMASVEVALEMIIELAHLG